MPNHRCGKPTISRAWLTRFELVMREPKSRALPLGDSPRTGGNECNHTAGILFVVMIIVCSTASATKFSFVGSLIQRRNKIQL